MTEKEEDIQNDINNDNDIDAYHPHDDEGNNDDELQKNSNQNVVTRTSTRSTTWRDPGPPPDGGWLAWSQGVCLLPHLPPPFF